MRLRIKFSGSCRILIVKQNLFKLRHLKPMLPVFFIFKKVKIVVNKKWRKTNSVFGNLYYATRVYRVRQLSFSFLEVAKSCWNINVFGQHICINLSSIYLLLETKIIWRIFSHIREHSGTRFSVVRILCAGVLKVGRNIPRKSYKNLINVMALVDICPFYRNHPQISAYCIYNITKKQVFWTK
jgi:hypothetical protein